PRLPTRHSPPERWRSRSPKPTSALPGTAWPESARRQRGGAESSVPRSTLRKRRRKDRGDERDRAVRVDDHSELSLRERLVRGRQNRRLTVVAVGVVRNRGTPRRGAPGGAAPGGGAPGGGAPGGGAPGGGRPRGRTPGSRAPGGAAPGGIRLGGAAPARRIEDGRGGTAGIGDEERVEREIGIRGICDEPGAGGVELADALRKRQGARGRLCREHDRALDLIG